MARIDAMVRHVCDDVRVVFDPGNVSTMALPLLVFARTLVEITHEQTKDATYLNPLTKLMTNNYLGASMVLRQTHLGKAIEERCKISPGAGEKIFDAVTDATVQMVAGAEKFLEADRTLLTAVIDELQAIRAASEKRRDEDGAAPPASGPAPDAT